MCLHTCKKHKTHTLICSKNIPTYSKQIPTHFKQHQKQNEDTHTRSIGNGPEGRQLTSPPSPCPSQRPEVRRVSLRPPDTICSEVIAPMAGNHHGAVVSHLPMPESSLGQQLDAARVHRKFRKRTQHGQRRGSNARRGWKGSRRFCQRTLQRMRKTP